ncbi:hypothetical protein L2E82_44828 [Cichorium intybus]|uniref:Uncharacterized protein n=1 Tax=Cichorium intybus TaxID=13427 RepID=A0ACB8ZQB3_CICIN|nr:hypothetical protein L2E82_44828 [Cichorium intybus]
MTLQRDILINKRPGFLTTDETSNDTNNSNDTLTHDNLTPYKLPVGVKPLGDMKESPKGTRVIYTPDKNTDLETKDETRFSITMSYDESSTETDSDINKNSVYPDIFKKNGRLSARAASMLGRLSLGDGSMYDGLWRYGKRSGMGTFCFSNGDVFCG